MKPDNTHKYKAVLDAWSSPGNTAGTQMICKRLGVNYSAFTAWKYKKTRRESMAGPYKRRKPAVETIAVPESTDKLIALIGSHKAVMEAVRSFQ